MDNQKLRVVALEIVELYYSSTLGNFGAVITLGLILSLASDLYSRYFGCDRWQGWGFTLALLGGDRRIRFIFGG